jgi:hypothetical protein
MGKTARVPRLRPAHIFPGERPRTPGSGEALRVDRIRCPVLRDGEDSLGGRRMKGTLGD